jgi:hypothetical protein
MCSGINVGGQLSVLETTILSADVQQLGSSPFLLIADPDIITIPIFAFFYINRNQTIPYSGFTHVNLATSSINIATFSQNSSPTNNLEYNGTENQPYNFLMNFRTTPIRYGGMGGVRIFLNMDTDPTLGDGDLTLFMYYIQIINPI